MAGREVGISQPSVSPIVAALEKRLGARLLRRSTRGAKLTDAGLDYLARTKAILTALDEADHATPGHKKFGVLRPNLAAYPPIKVKATYTSPHQRPC
jgi:DNA-binding transcriptional LysR family regulator